MKITHKIGVLLTLLFLNINFKAQIAGTFSVPTDFPNMAAAINTLNVMGVAGSVTIYVSAGYTETVAVGGLKLFNIPGATATSQVTFVKNGSGANPLLVAYSGGTATPSSAIQDGVWWLIGADYVTIDGIDILDPNTSNPATMEFGYGLYNASTSNGCHYNTIKNCVVTLNRINAVAGPTLNAGGSRAIEAMCVSYTANVTTFTPSSAAGTNSYNKFYSNTLQNCHNGIALMGYQSASPYTLSDKQNDIGGTSAVSGNTVINFAGGGSADASGIRTKAQYSLNTSYNVVKNNTGIGQDPAGNLHAIYLGAAPASSTSVNGNTITLTVATSTIDIYGIFNSTGSSSATINIVNNVFTACTFTSVLTSIMIYDYSSSAVSNISNNLFNNITGANYPRSTRMIQTSNSFLRTISSNTVSNYTATGALYAINVNGDQTLTISNNLIDNISGNSVDGIFHAPSPTTFVCVATMSSNTMRNIVTNESYGIYSGAFGSTRTITGNAFYNISTPTVNPSIYGIDYAGIFLDGGEATIEGNSIYSVTSSGATSTVTIYGISGIQCYGVDNSKINRNKIGSLTSDTRGFVRGIRLEFSDNYTVTNNVIGDLNATNSNRSDGLVGIYVDANSTSHYVYYNTVYLNSASSSTANFGSAAIIFPATGNTSLRNNILVNTSVNTGTGVATVIRKLNSTLSYYATTSNNNILYAGTPAANRYIYHDGTNTYTTLADFKTYASPRESQSYTENPPFITTNGSQSNFLNLNSVLGTLAESGAVAIAGFTTDYIGTSRNASTPDIGAREGNFTQADIFSPTLTTMGFTTPQCNLSGRTVTVNFTDPSGVASGSLSPRIYYRLNFGLYTNSQGSLTAGTYTNGIWTFTMSYSANTNDIVRYFFAAQDISSFNNVGLYPATGGSITNVNNIPVPPTNTYTFQIDASATITATGGSVCAGSSFTIVPSGAATYSITGGSFTVNPLVSTTYSVTGTSSTGCTPQTPATVNIVVYASPSIVVNSGTICSGQVFTMAPSGASTYSFSNGSATVNPLVNTSYSISGTNVFGCVSMSPAISSVTVFTTPTISAASGSICSGNVFTIVPSGANTYTFSSVDTTVSPVSNTNYSVTGTSLAGCVASNTSVLTVTVNPTPTLVVSNGTVCSGRNYTIVPSGASTYTFSGGSAIVSPMANTAYSVTGTSSAGCIALNTAIANITVLVSPIITVNSGSICSGQSFTILPSGALNYTFAGGSATVSPLSNTNYTVSGTNSLGCVALNPTTSSVTVYATPTISAASGSICSGNVFTIVPLGANSYTFSSVSATVNPSSNTNYTVTGTSAAGCIASNTAVLTVTVNPTPTIAVNNGTLCSGRSYTIIPSGANNYIFSGGSAIISPTANTSYSVTGTSSAGCPASNTATGSVTLLVSPTISVNSGSICSGQNFVILPSGALTYTYAGGSATVSPLSNTNYTVSGTNSLGCVALNPAIANITVYTTPTISAASGSICSGGVFTISPSGANTYTFSAGSATISPTSNTDYSVTGTSLMGCIASNTAVLTVTVNTIPIISVSSGTLCSGQNFTIIPSGASTYSYSGGSAVVSPATNTSYAVTGTSSAGCVSSNTAIAGVTVLISPSISVNSGSICSGQSFIISPSGATSYSYAGGSATVSPLSSASYSVSGTNSLGCLSNVAFANVTVNITPTVSANSGTICAGNFFLLNPTGASTYIISGGSVTVSPLTNTTYSVSGISSAGCLSSNTAVAGVTVIALPTVGVNSGSICAGQVFILVPTGAATYSYSSGSHTVAPSVSSSYSVIGISAAGCISQSIVVSHVTVIPNPSVTVNSGAICQGETFTITPSGAATYTIQGGNALVTPASTSNYTVAGTSTAGCLSSNTAVASVTVNPLPTITVLSSNTLICEGETATLSASGASSYTFNPGGAVTGITISPNTTTTYTITGTDANNCSNTAVITQSVDACLGIRNEKLKIVNEALVLFPNPTSGIINLESRFEGEIIILNTLGQQVYSAKLSAGQQQLNLEHLAKGVYLVRVKSIVSTKSVRLLKE